MTFTVRHMGEAGTQRSLHALTPAQADKALRVGRGVTLWQTFDGYAPSSGERTATIPLSEGGPHRFEIRCRAEHSQPAQQAAGHDPDQYLVRFRQLVVPDAAYTLQTIDYTYDALSRLRVADYNSGATVFTDGYDLASNLTDNNGASRTYNAANQLVDDGTNSLTVQQDALSYILDLQPGLAQVVGGSDGSRYVHGPRGIHAVNEGAGWEYPVTDGLGSVRGYVDTSAGVLSHVNYTPIGMPDSSITGPAFTGEWRDATGVQYHRARYLSPGLGVWLSRDPFEGTVAWPMSLNGYSWVEGDTPNRTDSTGMFGEKPEHYATCTNSVSQADSTPRAACHPDSQTPNEEIYWNCLECCTAKYSQVFEAFKVSECLEACHGNPLVNPTTPFGLLFEFEDSEYPEGCVGKTAEECMLYHLRFLANTDTIQFLRTRIPTLYHLQLFASFVAPDRWNPHPLGTPADIKFHYGAEVPIGYGKCMSLFGNEYGFDLSGNLTYGYIGRVAGFSDNILRTSAGIAQFLDTGALGDPLEDTVAVDMGIALYERCGQDCSMDHLASVLEDFRQAYLATLSDNSACPNPE